MSGTDNSIADSLSCLQIAMFGQLVLTADTSLTLITASAVTLQNII